IDDEMRARNLLLHLVHLNRAAARDLEVPAKAPRLVEVAGDDPDFGGGLQGGGHGSGGAAGADDRDAEAPTLPSPAGGGGKRLDPACGGGKIFELPRKEGG